MSGSLSARGAPRHAPVHCPRPAADAADVRWLALRVGRARRGRCRWADRVRRAFADRGPADPDTTAAEIIDLRPWVLMPGMVDLHAHLPQLPNAGLGAGMDLLAWLERYIFPLERELRRPDRRTGRARCVARIRCRGHDDGARVRRGLRGEPRHHVPGCRGARHPGDRRQGDDGSDHLRPDDRARRPSSAGLSPRVRG